MDVKTEQEAGVEEVQDLLEIKDGVTSKPDDEEVIVKCGLRGCAPRSLQPCANVRAYTASTSIILLLHIATFTYGVGNGRTLERRFGLSNTEMNLPASVADLLSTCIGLVIGYFGHRMHKPRVIALSNLLVALSVALYVAPYLLYGAKDARLATSASGAHNTSGVETLGGLCRMTSENVTTDAVCASGRAGYDVTLAVAKRGAYACMVAAAVLAGIGLPSMGTLSLPYLDENCANDDSALYTGIVTSMYAWSPVLGFLLAAVCTRLPENLVGPTDLTPDDPRWIGAWWLGFLILGFPMLFMSIPIAMFPKHLKYYYTDNNKTKKPKEKRHKKFSFSKELKNFPKELWSLLSNMAFLMLTCSKVCGLYVVTGIFLQAPRYMEIHFRQPAYMANIVSGTSGAVVGAIGSILGGVLMKRMKMGVVGSARMYVYALSVGVVCTAISMFLGCPQQEVAGTLNPHTNRLDVGSQCNAGCGCPVALKPVCVNGTTSYISPCHAGCTSFDALNKTFSDCACAGPEVSVTAGYCTDAVCGMLLPYVLVGVFGSLLGSIGRVPATMLMFRIVKKEEKAFALGILTFAINLLCFVPSPILFGQLFDSACRLWEESCGTRGACLLYDVTRFRLYMHGVTLAFQVASLVFGVVVLVLVTRQHREPAAVTDNKAGNTAG